MNIIEAYIKFKGQLLILVSGIRGSGRGSYAEQLGKDLKISVHRLSEFIKKDYDGKAKLPTNEEVVNTDSDEAYDWKKLSELVEKEKKLILVGTAFPDDKMKVTADVSIQIATPKQKCLESVMRAEKANDESINEKRVVWIYNNLTYPYYKDATSRMRIDKYINTSTFESEVKVADEVFNTVIKHISDWLDNQNKSEQETQASSENLFIARQRSVARESSQTSSIESIESSSSTTLSSASSTLSSSSTDTSPELGLTMSELVGLSAVRYDVLTGGTKDDSVWLRQAEEMKRFFVETFDEKNNGKEINKRVETFVTNQLGGLRGNKAVKEYINERNRERTALAGLVDECTSRLGKAFAKTKGKTEILQVGGHGRRVHLLGDHRIVYDIPIKSFSKKRLGEHKKLMEDAGYKFLTEQKRCGRTVYSGKNGELDIRVRLLDNRNYKDTRKLNRGYHDEVSDEAKDLMAYSTFRLRKLEKEGKLKDASKIAKIIYDQYTIGRVDPGVRLV